MLIRRIGATVVANVYCQIVNVIGQLGLVYVFLRYWSEERYGSWILLMTVPSYLAITDLGVGTACGNRTSIAMATGDVRAANCSIQTASSFYTVTFAALLVTAGTIPQSLWLSAFELSAAGREVVVLLTVYVYLSLILGVVSAIYRAAGRNARGVWATGHFRASEMIVTMVVLAIGADVPKVIVAMTVLKALALAVALWDSRRIAPMLHTFGTNGSFNGLKELLPAGLGFLGVSIASVLLLQGMTLTVGAKLGAVAVVSYNTLRSLARLVIQAMGLINNAVWPELSTLYATRDLSSARNLQRLAVSISAYVALGASAMIICVGPKIVSAWTHGAVHSDRWLLAAFTVPVVLNSVWYTSSTILVATNNNAGLSVRFAVCSVSALVLAQFVVPKYGVYGAATVVLLLDVALIPYVITASCRLLNDRVPDFIVDVATCRTLRRSASERFFAKRP